MMKRAIDHEEEDTSHTMATNFESPYHLCQLAHPLLKASENGCIVFISSVAGIVALPALSVYAASKGKKVLMHRILLCTKVVFQLRRNANRLVNLFV